MVVAVENLHGLRLLTHFILEGRSIGWGRWGTFCCGTHHHGFLWPLILGKGWHGEFWKCVVSLSHLPSPYISLFSFKFFLKYIRVLPQACKSHKAPKFNFLLIELLILLSLILKCIKKNKIKIFTELSDLLSLVLKSIRKRKRMLGLEERSYELGQDTVNYLEHVNFFIFYL